MQIISIGDHRAAVLECHRFAEQIFQHGASCMFVGAVATQATIFQKRLPPVQGQGPFGPEIEPALVICRLINDYFAGHPGMIRPAILCTK